MEEKKEYILCAAIRRIKPRECPNPYYEGQNDILGIELGYRHCDILIRFKGEVSTKETDQGFYTSKGRFVNRQEAMKIAFDAEQLEDIMTFCGDVGRIAPLYSEDLY